jgi:hypothetical protein
VGCRLHLHSNPDHSGMMMPRAFDGRDGLNSMAIAIAALLVFGLVQK